VERVVRLPAPTIRAGVSSGLSRQFRRGRNVLIEICPSISPIDSEATSSLDTAVGRPARMGEDRYSLDRETEHLSSLFEGRRAPPLLDVAEALVSYLAVVSEGVPIAVGEGVRYQPVRSLRANRATLTARVTQSVYAAGTAYVDAALFVVGSIMSPLSTRTAVEQAGEQMPGMTGSLRGQSDLSTDLGSARLSSIPEITTDERWPLGRVKLPLVANQRSVSRVLYDRKDGTEEPTCPHERRNTSIV
jgi:hypothetical protein